ncbi:protein NRT1/ PTR FAMILY 5.7 [Dendrobium catenatum]|uniref:Putative peptide/nitrate transporter n=1 Tax=Dendrobium catenatum TaxID=906689 RepID=A0A2I0WN80_9ASPA|nr:protein NRT1/ PTR FAMILY 5.7 [Dendrobium catenatum]PKU77108.1 putative peptide/nitrate transporter [Dendrobium catenatum]
MENRRDNADKWVHDSSIDYKRRTPLRASTGVWKASLFIIAIEFSERLSYFGLSVNLIIYLTKFLHYELKEAAKSVNCWLGVTTLMAPIGGFMADAYLGRFATVLLSSLVYIVGLTVLTMSQLVPALKPNNSMKLHKTIFFTAIYLISIGTGGHKPSLESFGADQFDDDHPTEHRQKLSFFNWWNLGLCCGLLLGVTLIVYVEDTLGYGLAVITLTFIMLLSLFIFLLGRPFYRFRVPRGSPLAPLFQTFATAVSNRHLPLPPTADQLYEIPNSDKFLRHTDKFRFLDKAAIVGKDQQSSRRLATVTQVEELKLVFSMIPIWLTSVPFGICVTQTSTFFIKQASTMNRKLAAGFEIPPASVYALGAVAMIISVSFYEKLLVPFLRRATGNERGISLLQRIGIGIAFSILAMATAAIVEKKRLWVAEAEKAATLSMSVFWLVPQFMILGLGDGFAIVGLQEYFYDQIPDSMRSQGIALYLSAMGAASFLSSVLITVVDHVTRKMGTGSWFAKDLNKSRLDLFYWLLAVINGVNLCVYLFVARRYSYKSVERRVGMDGSQGRDGGGAMAEP